MKPTITLLKFFIIITVLIATNTVHSQFSGVFDPSNWTLFSVGSNSDAFVDVTGAPAAIVLFGNNSGAADPGTLFDDYNIMISCPGVIDFDYSHVNPDIDDAYYSINGVETFITNAGAGSIVGVTINSGDVFGFRVKGLI